MDFRAYIDSAEKADGFRPTGLDKQCYLDVCELALSAYELEYLENLTDSYARNGIADIQSYGRILCVLGALIANGRKTDWLPLWERMMDLACTTAYTITHSTLMDFAVKEIMLAFHAMEPRLTPQQRKRWLDCLARIAPENNYTQYISSDCPAPANICVYNMAGEYLREGYGLCRTEKYFRRNWPAQLRRFDENGMYIDPNAPMLYDLTTRCQIQLMLHFGYRGEFYGALDHNLEQAALHSLFLQSSCYEFPYGGRSNQFLFNEALLASNFEYEAARYQQRGDTKTAGMFKRAAHLAMQSIRRWLALRPAKHIKNMFRFDSAYGAEGYGYYDKYMITLGSFVYPALLYADDSIGEFPCPAELGGYVLQTSETFHKVAANACGYSVEVDTAADFHYDATGLGRLHRCGAPTELAISVPFAGHPAYCIADVKNRTLAGRGDIDAALGAENPENLCITPSIQIEGKALQRLCDFSGRLTGMLAVLEETDTAVSFSITYRCPDFDGFSAVTERYHLSAEGLHLTAAFDTDERSVCRYEIPLLMTNGTLRSHILQTAPNEIVVTYEGASYSVCSEHKLDTGSSEYRNRNGIYRRAAASCTGSSISIHLKITPSAH